MKKTLFSIEFNSMSDTVLAVLFVYMVSEYRGLQQLVRDFLNSVK